MTPHADRLGHLYAAWGPASVTPAALAATRMALVDVAGCIVGGSGTAEARTVAAFAAGQGGTGEATVLGTRLRLPPALAALANGTAGHALDYDDMSFTSLAHPSVVLAPAVLALAEADARSGREVVEAYGLGFEVLAYFGRAMVPAHYEAGWHSTATLGVLGAAAAASRMLRLDGERMLHALAMAASTAGGLRANFGTWTKALHAGHAAESGVRAAMLAARGFTGNPAALDGQDGFVAVYGAGAEPKAGPDGLDIESGGIGIKPYACCGAGVALVDAALDLRAAHGVRGEDVAAVHARVSRMAAAIMPFHAPRDGAQARYSLAYCAAVALLDAAAGMAQFADARVARPDVRALVARTRIEPDPSLAQGGGRFGVALEVTLHDGRRFEAALEIPRGNPSRPLDPARLHAKFHECADAVLGEDRARRALEALERIEDCPDIRDITRILEAP